MLKIVFIILSVLITNICQAYPSTWKYHHIGIPTKQHNKHELYDTKWKYYTWGYDDSEFNIQMHRFDADSPVPALAIKYPHIAFRVPNLSEAIKGRKVIFGPLESKKGLFVAMIQDPATGMPVELLQSKYSKAEMIKKYHDPLKLR